MADQGRVEWVNAAEIFRGLEASPKAVNKLLAREFKRGVRTFRNKTAAKLFRGPPGIFLPERAAVATLKRTQKGQKGKASAGAIRKAKALAHIKAAALGTQTGFFVFFAYLSRFSEFHRKQLEPIFNSEFRTHARLILDRIRKERTRIIQLAIDGKVGGG